MDIANFKDHDLIKTSTIFFLYDQFPEMGFGWTLPIYFDRTSNVFRVFDCPKKGLDHEMSELPKVGLMEFITEDPVQYAKDRSTNVHKARIIETS